MRSKLHEFLGAFSGYASKGSNLSGKHSLEYDRWLFYCELNGSEAEKVSAKVKEFLNRTDLSTDVRNFITKINSFLDENLTVLQSPSAITYRAQGASMVVGQLP